MSSILLLLHLLPPVCQGRKKPGKISASKAEDHIICFTKVIIIYVLPISLCEECTLNEC